MDRAVEISEQRRVYDGFVAIDEAILRYERFGGGWTGPVRRVKVERGDSAAAIVTSADTGRVILVEQFRYPALANSGGWLVETVAGRIDGGETPEDAVRREIREEIGYEPRCLERIATFYPSPGAASERIFLFWAEVAEAGRVHVAPDDDEDVALREYTPEALGAALDAGELVDAKTIIAATWLRNRATERINLT